MRGEINQAVVFTKPIHHLELSLTPRQLDEQTRTFLVDKGFTIVMSRTVTGRELAARDVIRQHYLMYSKAACIESTDELELTAEAQAKFKMAFGNSWVDEATKVFGSPALQQEKGISAHELYLQWNKEFSGRKTQKIQDGIIMAWLASLDCYCINAFYPAMEENFYNPATEMTYYVVEFNPDRVSWTQFRKNVLGATDASKADPESFRGQLYAIHSTALEYPGRDNFVHGSAGPIEGLVERTIHESDFDMLANPVGCELEGRGVTLEKFKYWKANQTLSQLGELFDATEERDTFETFSILDKIQLKKGFFD